MRRALLFVAVLAAVVLTWGASADPTAHAETDGSVAIGCEFLGPAIDGDPGDVPSGADFTDACDGIDINDVAGLASALGDQDDILEAADFNAIDLDLNQVQDGGSVVADETVLFAFVDNDQIVTFDAETGLIIVVHDDFGGFSADGDANPETCDSADDLDCDAGTLSDGDGVVVATAIDDGSASSDPGDTIDVDMFQADDTGQVNTETINIVGDPDQVTLTAFKSTLQISGGLFDFDDCLDESDAYNIGQMNDSNRAFLRAAVSDDDGRELTRISVDFEVNDDNIASIGDDSFEPASAPKAAIRLSSVHPTLGTAGAFAVVCGGTTSGAVTITATENVNDNDADVVLQVVGEPGAIELQATPPELVCDNVNTATITATVRDGNGSLVADGNAVNFSVSSVGVVNPINTTTVNGIATTTFRGYSTWSVGVPVIVTAGDAQASILIICQGVADVDGDGLPNAFENARACLDANVADGNLDQDADAITSINEFFASGTEPCVYDTDTDGCADGEELGDFHITGGQRDPLNRWDYYDVNGTRRVDAVDIGLVRANFNGIGPTPAEDVKYDRSPGAAPWAPGPPNNVINAIDIALVRASFPDRCDQAP